MYKLLFSYVNSSLCAWLINFLIPILLLRCTTSPIYITASYAVGILPYILVTPIAGVLGDRLNKKIMIQIGELFGAFLILLLIFFDDIQLSIILLLIIHFFLSSIMAIHHPIFQAWIPYIVKEKK